MLISLALQGACHFFPVSTLRVKHIPSGSARIILLSNNSYPHQQHVFLLHFISDKSETIVTGEWRWFAFHRTVVGSTWLLAALLQAQFLILLHYRYMKRTLKSGYQLCATSVTIELDVWADSVSAEEEDVVMNLKKIELGIQVFAFFVLTLLGGGSALWWL